jgi:hypothetical protein
MRVPEFLREPIEVAQARLETLEKDAQKLFKDISGRVQKEWKQDWPEMKDRVDKLLAAGRERAVDWRGRAEHVRADAMERLMELVKFLGVATRDQLEQLSRDVDRILKKIEKPRKPRRKGARKAHPARAAKPVEPPTHQVQA